MNADIARKALIHIALLEDGKDYKSVTKSDLWEALKYARHIAKIALESKEA